MQPSAGHRAPPLPPDQRRLTILDTAVRIIHRDQAMPSTRRLARECGIAEGTLFRAFPTKDALIQATVSYVACPHPFRMRLLALPPETVPTLDGLRQRLLEAAQLLQERFTFILTTLAPLGVSGLPRHGPHAGCPEPAGSLDSHVFGSVMGRVLAPYHDDLRVEPDVVVDALRYLTFAGCHRGISHGRAMTPATVVDLLLDGALTPAATPAPAPQAAPAPAPAATLAAAPRDGWSATHCLGINLPLPNRSGALEKEARC